MSQPRDNPSLIADLTASKLTEGSEPGSPRHTSQTKLLGSISWYDPEHEQNILLSVLSCTWTSSPITCSIDIRTLYSILIKSKIESYINNTFTRLGI